MKKKNRKYVVIPLLLLLLLVTVGGTVAWLTATNTKTNTFTVGQFNVPEKMPNGTTDNTEGFLVEPSWDTTAAHKLLPGVTFAKDPMVGLGEGSEPAVVYIQVDNDLTNKVYFTLNNGWTAVSGCTTAAATGAPANSYTSGLFKYSSILEPAASGDTYTNALFSNVVVASDAQNSDITVQSGDPEITVKSFIHQAYDASGQAISDADVIKPAAVTALGATCN